MKYRIKPNHNNLVTMIGTFIMLIVTCILWIVLKEYLYFGIFLGLTLIIMHMYFFTFYILNDNYLIIKMGLLPIRIKYKSIKKMEVLDKSVKLYLNLYNTELFPNDVKGFASELKKKI